MGNILSESNVKDVIKNEIPNIINNIRDIIFSNIDDMRIDPNSGYYINPDDIFKADVNKNVKFRGKDMHIFYMQEGKYTKTIINKYKSFIQLLITVDRKYTNRDLIDRLDKWAESEGLNIQYNSHLTFRQTNYRIANGIANEFYITVDIPELEYIEDKYYNLLNLN